MSIPVYHSHMDACSPHPHPTGTLWFSPCDDEGCDHHGWHQHSTESDLEERLFVRHDGVVHKNLHPFMD